MTRNDPRPSRRAVLGGAAGAALAVAAGAGSAVGRRHQGHPADQFPLPDGWLPEGITIGRGPYAYMGSRADGAVYRTDLRTGEGRVVHEGGTGLAAIGLKLDHDGLLYIAGGGGGTARIIDSRTGELLRTHRLTGATGHFVNDVVLLGDRAWFTDSYGPVLYGVPARSARRRALPLTGDWEQTPDVINANGVVSTPRRPRTDRRQDDGGRAVPRKPPDRPCHPDHPGRRGRRRPRRRPGPRRPHAVRRTEPAQPGQRVGPGREGGQGDPAPHDHRPPLRRPRHRRPFRRPPLPRQRASTSPQTPETTFTAVAVDR